MRVLVIGAAGELGRGILARVRERGVETIGLSRRPAPGSTVGDLADPDSLVAAFSDVDTVFLQSSPTIDQLKL